MKQGDLLIHVEGARPLGDGPFAAVLVHPEAGWPATAMRGILWDLARQGYLAVAADYRRLIDGEYRRNLFVWRSEDDVTAALDYLSALPQTDKQRIATLGYSQGGVYALVIAAHAPQTVKAVVAYYPVTDFKQWLKPGRHSNPLKEMVYDVIRWHFKRESGAESEEAFEVMLQKASPLYYAESLHAPVLLIHGENDTTASVEESQRLAARLRSLQREVRLLVIPGGRHVFNFKNPDLANRAWKETLNWLARHLAGKEDR